ncbi:MAG TPA: serine/threonine-protein kinase, partial [Kofleriaceae bacterium]|nr:serine/threonine-protein kinase [Kofleriaceae bacterium]
MPAADDPTAPVQAEVVARMLAEAPTASATPAEVELGGPQLAAGTRLRGRYRIVRFIARGGMGEVYEAEDTALHTRVALKTVRSHIADDPHALTRFRREIQVARTVTHPNVCRVFDLDHHDPPGGPTLAFYTMEFLAGETLAARLRRGSPAPAEARRILDDLLAGIAAAHAAGVIHRDLKPANVMLLDKGGRAVITDFGLALPVGTMIGTPAAGASADGTTVAGTPAYMAPELVAGAAPSVATDLYALGVCMFELQHGRLPVAPPTPEPSASATSSQPAPLPPVTGEGAAWRDRRWERATRACLAEDPALRP